MYSWKKLLQYKPKEFENQTLEVEFGQIPQELQGTLYKNSSTLFPRKNGQQGHLFDGDGAVLKVTFSKSDKPIASYKFIRTPGFVEDENSNGNFFGNIREFQSAGLGRTAIGNRFTKIWRALQIKNVSSTSLLPLREGPLLTLWEGGLPYAVEKYSLKTLGQVDTSTPFSAHPKVCGITGRIFNFGTKRQGPNSYINVYEMSQKGQIIKRSSTQIRSGHFMIHDFVLAGQYLVVPIYPNIFDGVFDLFTGSKSYGELCKWAPERGVEIVIFDKDTLQVVGQGVTNDPYYVWHYSNGFVDENGNIVIKQATYKNFDSFTNFMMDNMLDPKNKELFGKSCHERVIINPKSGKILDRTTLHNQSVEFLVVDDADVGQKWSVTYGAHIQRVDDWPNGIIRFENEKQQIKTYEEGQYVFEPYYIQDKTKQKGEGWIILTFYDGLKDKSYVDILDSQTLDLICRMRLPFNVSISFHGRFDPI